MVGDWFQDNVAVFGDTQVVVNNTRGKSKRSESGVGSGGSRDLISQYTSNADCGYLEEEYA